MTEVYYSRGVFPQYFLRSHLPAFAVSCLGYLRPGPFTSRICLLALTALPLGQAGGGVGDAGGSCHRVTPSPVCV